MIQMVVGVDEGDSWGWSPGHFAARQLQADHHDDVSSRRGPWVDDRQPLGRHHQLDSSDVRCFRLSGAWPAGDRG
jgi:hypothetical protein